MGKNGKREKKGRHPPNEALIPLAPEKNLNFETKKVKITGVLSGNTQTLTGTESGSASGSSAEGGKGTLTLTRR